MNAYKYLQDSSKGSNFAYFQDLLSSMLTRAGRLPALGLDKYVGGKNASLASLAEMVVAARGEVSALVHAERMLIKYADSSDDERLAFFHVLLNDFALDANALLTAAGKYAAEPSANHYSGIFQALKSRRQSLFRRLNATQHGTIQLVRLRRDLLQALQTDPLLKPVDIDLVHLFHSWFNRGFLVMKPIDWTTPAHILEKIIAYEAVHEIGTWQELRLRLQPSDRRCFAFFHLAMQDEPLIFVEVALTDHIPAAIQTVLSPERTVLAAEEATAAVFYSISNCQSGLAGISFGNFLIKQVASDLRTHLPNLTDFVTLSPLPGFMKWLQHSEQVDPAQRDAALALLAEQNWQQEADKVAQLNEQLPVLAAQYLLTAKTADGQAQDPVARFHLGNGARLERINPLADVSAKGLRQAAGVMVNYYYDLSRVEQYHEAYAEQNRVTAARGVLKLLAQRPETKGMQRAGVTPA